MSSPAILLVDDRPEQRLALNVVLGELGEVVEASSGREALRWLLRREFAVILLDVNMPGMDGLETAGLIRQRASSRHTPIIFVTACGDDAHALRGYELGAVDYILTPVEPQILRTKVSVFLELFRKRHELTLQAESTRRQAVRLQRLSDAAVAIHGASSLEDLAKVVADAAVSAVGVVQVAVELDAPAVGEAGAAALAGRHASRCSIRRPEGTALELLARTALTHGSPRAVRMTRQEIEGHPQWGALGDSGAAVPLHGWLAVPLTSRDGLRLGWIQLSEKLSGDFTGEDEAVLTQLAQMASIAAENTMLKDVREASQLKDQFLATLSHELRTPLQAILTWARMLRDESVEPTMLERGLEVIERSAFAQARLIDDLLDVSRILRGTLLLERRPLRLSEIVDAAIEDVRPAAHDKKVELASERGADPVISGDANRLRQVMSNLLSNAIKFTPEEGRVTLRLEEFGGDAQLCVEDTGIGIEREFLPRLFERFHQADASATRSHRGLGIGLAIVRHLVELHGGSVRGESDGTGKGARFILRLPLATPDSERIGRSPAPSRVRAQTRLDGVRVLLVDDEEDTRDCLAMALLQHGAEVIAKGSAADALAVLDGAGADVLISDLAMPGEDGFALIRRVRGRTPERSGRIPAAAVSAFARPEERARAALAGFDLHLAKPVDPGELAAAVLDLASRSGG